MAQNFAIYGWTSIYDNDLYLYRVCLVLVPQWNKALHVVTCCLMFLVQIRYNLSKESNWRYQFLIGLIFHLELGFASVHSIWMWRRRLWDDKLLHIKDILNIAMLLSGIGRACDVTFQEYNINTYIIPESRNMAGARVMVFYETLSEGSPFGRLSQCCSPHALTLPCCTIAY